MDYYDGTRLLSSKDINGNTPELFIATSNRCAGKTTYFMRLLCNRYFKQRKKFCLLQRFGLDLNKVADKMLTGPFNLFFKDHKFSQHKGGDGIYEEIIIDDEVAGYAVAINNARKVKEASPILSQADAIFFDEFQAMDKRYCTDEVTKFMDIHTSLARGGGSQVKYLPVYMCSNTVSLINPYFTALGIATRLRRDTKFLRGNGFVMEANHNKAAAEALTGSGFMQAFSSGSTYLDYAAQGVYLEDNEAFIEKPKGRSIYKATIKYNGSDFGVREYYSEGLVYIDSSPDLTYPLKIVTTTDDHTTQYLLLRKSSLFIKDLRYYFEKGIVRIEDLRAKEAFLNTVAY